MRIVLLPFLVWLAKNLTKLSAQASLTTANGLFSGPAGLCSQADAERSERSLRPHVTALHRGDLALTRAVEEARNCGALRSACEQELLSTFPARPGIDATLH